MKRKSLLFALGLVLIGSFAILMASPMFTSNSNDLETNKPPTEEPLPEPKKIRLALLLDTSNSMDGLIDQAKSQLWNIVDEMTEARHGGVPAELHLALYEYGNDNLSVLSGYVREVSTFTQDLDEVSTQLFALTTNGGSEYCGTVINKSLDNLDWGQDSTDMKFIFIAGNEEFNQGLVSFEKACKKAAGSDVIVNTIYCGDYRQGIAELWKKGAELGGGTYMNIDMDQATVYIPSPYDDQIDSLNNALNDTYIGYGKQGAYRKSKQLTEDLNAQSLSQENKVKRTIAKSKTHAYKNESWDLVDALDKKQVELEKLSEEDLPEEMKNLGGEQKKAFILEKKRQREAVQKQIGELAKKRKEYVTQAQDSLKTNNGLERAILESVKSKAKQKSFEFDQ